MADHAPYPEFGSGYPFNVYLLIIIPTLLLGLGLLRQTDLTYLMMNLPIGMLTFYILLARFSSKIEINDINEFKVVYFFPWDDDVQIDLEDFEHLYYAKGLGYDVLRFTGNAYEVQAVVIKVNTRISDMQRMLSFIEKQTHLKVVTVASGQN
ncbi:hypothetical protein [Pedobacter hartonius]|uniref:PH domain-containing protein n=1 Tax=Pedobacter hartonius TaxID=425514 RepID=A0A1H4BJ00_9SPHI|nr:hypothetical protein [Pedobacter hartonius]SEA48077.1 hypothetical protein SAMN05443550_103367 [Pedobacter hartonius]